MISGYRYNDDTESYVFSILDPLYAPHTGQPAVFEVTYDELYCGIEKGGFRPEDDKYVIWKGIVVFKDPQMLYTYTMDPYTAS